MPTPKATAFSSPVEDNDVDSFKVHEPGVAARTDDDHGGTADAMVEFLDEIMNDSDDAELQLPKHRPLPRLWSTDRVPLPSEQLNQQPLHTEAVDSKAPVAVQKSALATAQPQTRTQVIPKTIYVNGREVAIEVDDPESSEGDDSDDPSVSYTEVASAKNSETPHEVVRALEYASWLKHQRYHDDMKFANERFIFYDFSAILPAQVVALPPRLLLAQNWRLGKGGLSWDAGFMLSEHLLRHPPTACVSSDVAHDASSEDSRPWIVELGSGPGLVGLALAGAYSVDVTLTDIGPVVSLAAENASRNECVGVVAVEELWWGSDNALAWRAAHRCGAPPDCIVGADLVYDIGSADGLGDSQLLLATVATLAGPNTEVCISWTDRLPGHLDHFVAGMRALFATCEVGMLDSNVNDPARSRRMVRAFGLHGKK
eukprot:SAG31_NODE_8397_length_1459_cov_1.169118_2_plen_428_part_00